jgi:hypothetical protein
MLLMMLMLTMVVAILLTARGANPGSTRLRSGALAREARFVQQQSCNPLQLCLGMAMRYRLPLEHRNRLRNRVRLPLPACPLLALRARWIARPVRLALTISRTQRHSPDEGTNCQR